ncbi:MAG TPA: surface lipoprotein assembly modifier [Caulobacteraceae bacterium]
MKSRKTALMAFTALLAAAIAGPALAAEPTLDDVLAEPDNIALNVAFAKSEANAGDLLSAAGALERVLIFQPNAHQARLFYAAVLYRLGDYQAASQQLSLLDNVELTPLQQAEKERYRRSIEKRLARFEVTGQVTGGVMYEEDALGAFLTQFDFFDPIEEEGYSKVFAGRIDAIYKLRPEGEYALYGSLSAYHKSDISGPDVEFERVEAKAGVDHVAPMSSWRAGAVVRQYWVMGDKVLTEAGVQGVVNKRLTTATTVHAGVEAVDQNFDNEPFLFEFVGGGRDGSRVDVNVGVTHRFSSRSTITAEVGHEWKDAEREALSYKAPYVQAGFEQLLGRGAYLDLTGKVRWVNYDGPDVLLFGETREDLRTDLRAALGAPVSAFLPAGATGDYRENIKIEGALSHTRRDSGSPLADYSSLGAEVRVIWRFGR